MSLVLPFEPTDIQGWTFAPELAFLHDESVRLADAGVEGDLLEVGCWIGRSTVALATAGDVDVVDTFEGSPEINDLLPGDQFEVFAMNMTRLGLGKRVHAYQGLSSYWLSVLPGPYRLIFVDGGHDYSTAYSDLLNAKRLLSIGGVMVVDDIYDAFPGVQRAVAEVLDNQVEELVKMGVWRKP